MLNQNQNEACDVCGCDPCDCSWGQYQLHKYLHDYQVGDLVVILQNVSWDEVTAIEQEIAIVVDIYDYDDEENFFDLLLQLADGGILPVWMAEVEKLECEH